MPLQATDSASNGIIFPSAATASSIPARRATIRTRPSSPGRSPSISSRANWPPSNRRYLLHKLSLAFDRASLVFLGKFSQRHRKTTLLSLSHMATVEDNFHKVPPQNLEAEMALLGALMIQGDAINR